MRSNCPLCHAPGLVLYRDLSDRLFHVPGRWTILRCSNTGCGLGWLDPVPSEELYDDYYTHHDPPAPSALQRAYRSLLRLTPLYRQRQRLNLMFLDAVAPGKLLEIGCGAGQRLADFRARGWQVEGVEPDAKAAARARDIFGLTIHTSIPTGQFDAIIMNHVLEHVRDPVALLAECRQHLKAGAPLLVATPNFDSRGHRRFGVNWRELEPPRHLHLFTPGSLRAAAQLAGFGHIEVWTTGARAVGIALGSFALQRRGRHDTRARPPVSDALRAVWFQLRATDEECVLRASG